MAGLACSNPFTSVHYERAQAIAASTHFFAAPCIRQRPSTATQHAALRPPTFQGLLPSKCHPSTASEQRQHRLFASKSRPLRVSPAVAASAAGQETASSTSSSSSLTPDRQGYRSFKMEGCEFLVSESPDGAMDLTDVYVMTVTEMEPARSSGGDADEPGDIPADTSPEEVEAAAATRRRVAPETVATTGRAAVSGELPPGPLHFHEAPWYSEFLGNVTEDKEPKRWLWKVYLIALSSLEPRALDLERMWVLDGKTRSVARIEVQRLAPPDTPPEDLRLRITRDGTVTLDTLPSIPSWENVVRASLGSRRATSALEQQILDRAEGGDGLVGSDEEDDVNAAPEVLYGEADEDNLRDFVEEWGDEDDEDFEADLSG